MALVVPPRLPASQRCKAACRRAAALLGRARVLRQLRAERGRRRLVAGETGCAFRPPAERGDRVGVSARFVIELGRERDDREDLVVKPLVGTELLSVLGGDAAEREPAIAQALVVGRL